MKTLHTIYHKKDETFDVNLFENAECTIPFDFNGKENLYIELKDGDVTPLLYNQYKINSRSRIFTPHIPAHLHSIVSDFAIENKINICTFDYASQYDSGLSQITPNLSKYIPEDNAVLFLSEEEYRKYCNQFKPTKLIGWLDNTDFDYKDWFQKYNIKTATIFLTHGTQSELQKANEVAKYLWENFGIKPDLCVLHWFGSKYEVNAFEIEYLCEDFGVLSNINKIITINSTGILKPEDSSERLQVFDCKEIFEEDLKRNN